MKDGTYKAVGKPNASMFTRYIGNMIGCEIPPYYRSWNDVSSEYKTTIISRLRDFFILDPSVPEWPKILTGIERECQDLYRYRKSKLKTHFDNVGGYKDIANARRNPPRHLKPENWDKTVDFFLRPKNKIRTVKNSQNRSHVKYPSLHGSSSYAATRYEKKNPETQEVQGPIENFHDMHHRSSSGWVNDLARTDHEAMLAEKDAQIQDHGSTSSSVNEKEIITKVLGKRCGHNVGIGRKLKRSAYALSFEPPTPTPQPPVNSDGMKVVFDALNSCNQYMYQVYIAPRGSEIFPPPVIDTQAILAVLFPGQARPQQARPQQAIFAVLFPGQARTQQARTQQAIFAVLFPGQSRPRHARPQQARPQQANDDEDTEESDSIDD